MKYSLFIFFNCIFLLVANSQSITFKYSIESTPKDSPPIPNMPTTINLEMVVINDLKNNFLIKTYLKNNSNPSFISPTDDINVLLINKSDKKIYTFDNLTHIERSDYLKSDTLTISKNSVNYEKYKCQIYNLKDNPNIKVYASKKLDKNINPGIDYYYRSLIGGIVRIEINTPKTNIVYQLISVEKSQSTLHPYLSVAKAYTILPIETKSILIK